MSTNGDLGLNRATPEYDAFISYAEPDRLIVAEPLATQLRAEGLSVWFAPWEAKVGQSLRKLLDSALAQSRYGIVVLSPSFFGRHWPEFELDGILQKEVDGRPVLLPVWHQVTESEVRSKSPSLAGRIAARWDDGQHAVVTSLLRAMRGDARAELSAAKALHSLALAVTKRFKQHPEVLRHGLVVRVLVRAPDLVIVVQTEMGDLGEAERLPNALHMSESAERWEAALTYAEREISMAVGIWHDLCGFGWQTRFSDK